MQPYTLEWLIAFAQSNGDPFTPPYGANVYEEEGIWCQILALFPRVRRTWLIPGTKEDVIICVQCIHYPDVVAVYKYEYVKGAIVGGAVNLGTTEIGQLIHQSLGRRLLATGN